MKKKFYIIAGESSGDFIGAKLMHQLKKIYPEIQFKGVGGPQMAAEGLSSLFPMENIAVMGLIEVLSKVFTIKKLIKKTTLDIQKFQPDMLITIDSLGFNKRVALAVKHTTKAKLVHYVAPTVWAWKPKRAKEISTIFDYLLCLFDFEIAYFKKEGLKTFAVGHPIIESGADYGSSEVFLKKYKLNPTDNFILLMPGSRSGEIKRLLPIFTKVASNIQAKYPNTCFIMPTVEHLKKPVKTYMQTAKVNSLVITGLENKYNSFALAKLALVASGTVTLELSLAKVPTVVAYKVNPITGLLAHMLIKVKFASIINIIANREIIKEFIQGNCQVNKISKFLLKILQYNKYYTKQDHRKILNILHNLGYNNYVPSEKAAQIICKILQGEHHE